MKRSHNLAVITLFLFSVFGSQSVVAQCPSVISNCGVNPRINLVSANITPRIQSYIEYLPIGYNPNAAAKYPLLIFWGGVCEIVPNPGLVGTQALCNFLSVAMPKVMNQGNFPESVSHDGQNYSYIVIAPLMTSIAAINNTFEADALLNHVFNNYRVDSRRIYTTGISFGSFLLMEHATSSVETASKFAAINPHAACYPNTIPDFSARLSNLASGGARMWGIQCNADSVCTPLWIQAWINGINSINPGYAKYTGVGGATCPPRAHPVFLASYDPSYRVDGKNVYEWMIQFQSNYIAYRQLSPKVVNGDWNNPATWSCNCIPQADDEVTIKTGQTVNVTPAMGPVTVRKLVQQPGSTLNVTGSLTVTN